MIRITRTVLVASMLALPLPLLGCATIGPDLNFDPQDWLAGDFLGSKKPLPGDRKAVFPEGVPGVARGVPPELMKGAPSTDLAAGLPPARAGDAVPDEPKQKAKAKPKPRPKVAAKPAPAPGAPPTRITVQRGREEGAWPEPPPPPAAAPAGAAWPDPPGAPRRAPDGVAWPDPPSR